MNMQSFEKLLGICTGYGGKYNPGRPNLRVENLSVMLQQAREKILQVSIAKTNYENAQNDRELAFDEIRFLSSRILAELKSSGALPETVADVAAMVRKIRGYSSSRKPVAATTPSDADNSSGTTVVNRSRSGKRFGYTIVSFGKLVQMLSTEPAYQPSLPELQVAYLKEKLARLQSVNEVMVSMATAWSLARLERDAFFYQGSNSLHSTAMAVKQQINATFGAQSEAARLASKIPFTKLYF
jgi:hypothetical protein